MKINSNIKTQMHYAKNGIITEQMKLVAKDEGLDA